MDMGRGAGDSSTYYALRQRKNGKALRVKWHPDLGEGAYVTEVGSTRQTHADTTMEIPGRAVREGSSDTEQNE